MQHLRLIGLTRALHLICPGLALRLRYALLDHYYLHRRKPRRLRKR